MKKILRFLRSMTFGMILLGLIAVCSLAGSLIPQGNGIAYYAQNYPKIHGLILSLRLFDVFGSWYFIALMTMLCINLSLCSLTRVGKLIQSSKNADTLAVNAKNQTLLTGEGLALLDRHLSSLRCKKQVREGVTVYSKNSFGRYGTFITHLSVLLAVLFGAAALYLPVITDRTCYPGEALTMDDGTTIYVDSFQIEDPDGTLNFSSVINVTLPDGRESGLSPISVNYPLGFGSYKIYQQTYGTAGSITVKNLSNDGTDTFTLDEISFLSMDGVNGLWFEALYPGYVRDEAGNFTLISSTSGRYQDPIYKLLLAADGALTPVLAFPGETLTVGELEYSFNAPVEFPGLRIKHTPPVVTALLFAVFVMMTAGLYLCFFTVPVSVRADEEGYAVLGARSEGLKLELEELLKPYERMPDQC